MCCEDRQLKVGNDALWTPAFKNCRNPSRMGQPISQQIDVSHYSKCTIRDIRLV